MHVEMWEPTPTEQSKWGFQTEHSIVHSESELQTFHVFTNTEKKPLDSTNDNGLCSLFA